MLLPGSPRTRHPVFFGKIENGQAAPCSGCHLHVNTSQPVTTLKKKVHTGNISRLERRSRLHQLQAALCLRLSAAIAAVEAGSMRTKAAVLEPQTSSTCSAGSTPFHPASLRSGAVSPRQAVACVPASRTTAGLQHLFQTGPICALDEVMSGWLGAVAERR